MEPGVDVTVPTVSSRDGHQAAPTGPAEPAVAAVRFRLDLAYDGTEFSGWARQPDRRTVQQVVEEGLARILRLAKDPRLTVAGRTDAGVHATGQVIHVDLAPEVDAARLARSLNGVLPADVRVLGSVRAPEGFDARFSAEYRRYVYRIADRIPDPLRRRDTLTWPRPLDVALLNAASRMLLGEHDFCAFCRRREGASTIRRLLRFDWERRPGSGVLAGTVVADAFCHSMVRALVGAVVAVGEGRQDPLWPAALLTRGVRDPGVHVVGAHGLTLVEVGYPSADLLGTRAVQTRRRRDAPEGASDARGGKV